MKLITPDSLVRPSALRHFEKLGNFYLEPKIDGSWCLLIIERKIKLISSGNREFAPGFVDQQIMSSEFHPSLFGTKILCELETHTDWSTQRRRNRGFVICHNHTVVSFKNKDMTNIRYDKNKEILRDIASSFRDDLSRIFLTMPYVDKNFEENYKEFKKEVCYEGAVLKNFSKDIIAPKNGRLKHWIKVKDFPSV